MNTKKISIYLFTVTFLKHVAILGCI